MKNKLTQSKPLLTSVSGSGLLYSGRLSVLFGETEEMSISASSIFQASVLGCDKFSLLAKKNDFRCIFLNVGKYDSVDIPMYNGPIPNLGNRFCTHEMMWAGQRNIIGCFDYISYLLSIDKPNLLVINMYNILAHIAHHERWTEQRAQILHVMDILRVIENLAHIYNCHICLLGTHEYETKGNEMYCEKEDYIDLRDKLDMVCSETYEVKKQGQEYVLYQDICSYAPCIDKIRFKFDDEGTLICTT